MDVGTLALLRTPEGSSALAAAAEVAGGDPLAAAAALRGRGIPGELAASALTQATLRLRAAAKFGADAQVMYFTRDGLEQATRAPVAARRAARLRASGVTHLADLGCGIGADTIACARAGIRVTAVEADPLTAAVAAANTAALGLDRLVTVASGRAETAELGTVGAAFCDPARRRGGGRVFDPAAYSPPWEFVTRLVETVPRTVLKVAPGITTTWSRPVPRRSGCRSTARSSRRRCGAARSPRSPAARPCCAPAPAGPAGRAGRAARGAAARKPELSPN